MCQTLGFIFLFYLYISRCTDTTIKTRMHEIASKYYNEVDRACSYTYSLYENTLIDLPTANVLHLKFSNVKDISIICKRLIDNPLSMVEGCDRSKVEWKEIMNILTSELEYIHIFVCSDDIIENDNMEIYQILEKYAFKDIKSILEGDLKFVKCDADASENTTTRINIHDKKASDNKNISTDIKVSDSDSGKDENGSLKNVYDSETDSEYGNDDVFDDQKQSSYDPNVLEINIHPDENDTESLQYTCDLKLETKTGRTRGLQNLNRKKCRLETDKGYYSQHSCSDHGNEHTSLEHNYGSKKPFRQCCKIFTADDHMQSTLEKYSLPENDLIEYYNYNAFKDDWHDMVKQIRVEKEKKNFISFARHCFNNSRKAKYCVLYVSKQDCIHKKVKPKLIVTKKRSREQNINRSHQAKSILTVDRLTILNDEESLSHYVRRENICKLETSDESYTHLNTLRFDINYCLLGCKTMYKDKKEYSRAKLSFSDKKTEEMFDFYFWFDINGDLNHITTLTGNLCHGYDFIFNNIEILLYNQIFIEDLNVNYSNFGSRDMHFCQNNNRTPISTKDFESDTEYLEWIGYKSQLYAYVEVENTFKKNVAVLIKFFERFLKKARREEQNSSALNEAQYDDHRRKINVCIRTTENHKQKIYIYDFFLEQDLSTSI